jgi:predicted mannosyl-3-phosphoglycerate phosphatase (HAD superfamily)
LGLATLGKQYERWRVEEITGRERERGATGLKKELFGILWCLSEEEIGAISAKRLRALKKEKMQRSPVFMRLPSIFKKTCSVV